MNEHAKLTPRNTDLLKNKMVADLMPPPPPHISEPEHKLGNGKVVETQKIEEKPPEEKQPLKVAILGTAPSSRDRAPYNDNSWQIWSCSPGNMNVPRADVWFEVHNNLLLPENISYGGPYIDWLKKLTIPIFMQDNSLVPNATPLPKDELVNAFGKYFFTSSFAWMMAMAIRAGASEIALFGVDMASKNEYILQRPGGHYFIQLAASRGIKVSIPFESDLAQPPALYGYEQNTPFGRKMLVRQQELDGRLAAMRAEKAKLDHGITFLEGAREDMDYIRDVWQGIQT